jgi:2-polyprenyl-3-methyl-5-hydroxy-6-metoxy-1,4-benzoquinol methylase
MTTSDGYAQNDEGFCVPRGGVSHRSAEYDEKFLPVLARMQDQHFWYKGRHRFLLHAVHNILRRTGKATAACRAIDLGGGCGGWVAYLDAHLGSRFMELAVGDSSVDALRLARQTMRQQVSLYQIDLYRLIWQGRWDVAFLLDVLEHLHDDTEILRQVRAALSPGGLLFVTVPALKFFWSDNDRIAGHLRRYTRKDMARLAKESGFRVLDMRYFMFFLSPLLLLQRLLSDASSSVGKREDDIARVRRSHNLPPKPINVLLSVVFALETPAGFGLPFPWGTSLMAVFQKTD